MDVNSDNICAFETPQNFYNWLAEHHDSETVLWLKIYKKGSGQQTITWNEAVIEALCWGWIDSIKKTFDETAYLQRFTPRKKGSVWSKRNREHVEKLIKENRMQEVGMVHVSEAQTDGRWEKAYAPASEMTVPEDFLAALDSRPKAKAFFETLNKTNLYAIAYRLTTAKKPETRQKRFNKFLEMLERGEKLY
ncbi:MAG: YdeI/OmpD-associated family protein [Deinococcota bacterium]